MHTHPHTRALTNTHKTYIHTCVSYNNCKKKQSQLGTVTCLQRQVDLGESQASLVYTAGSKTAGAVYIGKPCLKKEKRKKEMKEGIKRIEREQHMLKLALPYTL